MARTKAISLIQSGELKADLSELYGYVIGNVQKETLSSGLKSQSYTGNPASGSAEFTRFANSKSNPYGTARTAGKGDAIKAPKVPVNVSIHREIVEEAAKFDIDTFGAGNILVRRVDNHVTTMAAELDTAFFETALSAGSALTLTATDPLDILEEVIQALETVKNDYVRGVPRDMINVILKPEFYGKIRNKLDTQPNANVDTAADRFGIYHGVRVYDSIYLPQGVSKGIVMIDEAIAEPVVTNPYTSPEKIPLSNDYAVSLFYDYGCDDLTPDLIFSF